MDEEDEFYQKRQQCNSISDEGQRSPTLRLHFHGWQHQGLQSMVPREEEQCCGCPLLRLALPQLRTHFNFTPSFPLADAQTFCYITDPQRDQLMADLAAAAAAHERAITGVTHDNAARAWGRWTKYCSSIRCDDFYLDGLGRQEQILILRAFGMALRGGQISLSQHDTLVEGTIRGTIFYVVQAFWMKGRPNPMKDIDNELSVLLS